MFLCIYSSLSSHENEHCFPAGIFCWKMGTCSKPPQPHFDQLFCPDRKQAMRFSVQQTVEHLKSFTKIPSLLCCRKRKNSEATDPQQGSQPQEEGQENDGYESLNTYTALNVSTTRAAQTSSFFEEPIDPEYLEFQSVKNYNPRN